MMDYNSQTDDIKYMPKLYSTILLMGFTLATSIIVSCLGGRDSKTDESVDNSPPDTTLLTYPSSATNIRSANFTFISSEAESTFQCSIDEGDFLDCTSPTSYQGLAIGGHTFKVAATDTAGNTDLTPAMYNWTIDTAEACNGIDDDGDGLLAWWEIDNNINGIALCGGDCNDRASTFIQSLPSGALPAINELPSTGPELLQVVVEKLRSADVHNLVDWIRSELPDEADCVENSTCITSTWPIDQPTAYDIEDLGPKFEYSPKCPAFSTQGKWSSGYWRRNADPFGGYTENSTSTWVDGSALTVLDSANPGDSYNLNGMVGTWAKWHKYGDHLHRETDDHITTLLGTFSLEVTASSRVPLYEGVGIYNLIIARNYKEEVVSYPGASWRADSATISGTMTWDLLGSPVEIVTKNLSWSYRHDWDTNLPTTIHTYSGCKLEPLTGSISAVKKSIPSGNMVFLATVTFDGVSFCDGCGELMLDTGTTSLWCPIGGFFPER